jgi:hypothetical protein
MYVVDGSTIGAFIFHLIILITFLGEEHKVRILLLITLILTQISIFVNMINAPASDSGPVKADKWKR